MVLCLLGIAHPATQDIQGGHACWRALFFRIGIRGLPRKGFGGLSSQRLWKSGSAGRCVIAAKRKSFFLTTIVISRLYVPPREWIQAISGKGSNSYGRGEYKRKKIPRVRPGQSRYTAEFQDRLLLPCPEGVSRKVCRRSSGDSIVKNWRRAAGLPRRTQGRGDAGNSGEVVCDGYASPFSGSKQTRSMFPRIVPKLEH